MAFIDKKHFAYETVAALDEHGQQSDTMTIEQLLEVDYCILTRREKLEIIEGLQASGIIVQDKMNLFFRLNGTLSNISLYDLLAAIPEDSGQDTFAMEIMKEIPLGMALHAYWETDKRLRDLFDKVIDGEQVADGGIETAIPHNIKVWDAAEEPVHWHPHSADDKYLHRNTSSPREDLIWTVV